MFKGTQNRRKIMIKAKKEEGDKAKRPGKEIKGSEEAENKTLRGG